LNIRKIASRAKMLRVEMIEINHDDRYDTFGTDMVAVAED
jgi:hypothetical protein